MTEQALTAGGAYLSLEGFEKTYIDSMVTGLAGEYENIDKIEVSSTLEEEDLLWLIAINSAAHQQNLNEITAEEIQSFCTARLSFGPSLDFLTGEGGATTAILKINVQKPDPGRLMSRLGFNAQAKTWAGAMFEVLRDSDALDKYSSYFEDYRPSYEGDTSFEGAEAASSTAKATAVELTPPVLSAQAQRITWTWPPTRFRRGKTTGVMSGAPTAIS